MNAREQLRLKRALEALREVGSIGMLREDVLEMASLAAGGVMSSVEREALWGALVEGRYVIGHWEPVLRVERWALTERGAVALGGL